MDVFSFYSYMFSQFINILSSPVNLGIITVSLWSVFIGAVVIALFVAFIRRLFY